MVPAERRRFLGCYHLHTSIDARLMLSNQMNSNGMRLSLRVGRQVAHLLPRGLLPFVWHRVEGISGHLPRGIQYRLRRLAALINRDMGAIEQHYGRWIASYDVIDDAARNRMRRRIADMVDPPLISIVMPVYNPPPHALQSAINSVRDQLYPYWELCIADDVSTDPAVATVLREMQASDTRIKVTRRERNGHISAASNTALGMATGPFVALLDHDDLLPEHALFEVADRIILQPEVDILYSDEDHVDEFGRRCHPYFKPSWDPELLFAQNVISHLGVYRRSLLNDIGGFRLGFEGSQDHDLALRVAAISHPGAIAHIPKILYHWRQGTLEHTFSETARERCIVNSRRAVTQQLDLGSTVQAVSLLPLWNRVVYPLPASQPTVSIVLDAETSEGHVQRLLAATTYENVDVLAMRSAKTLAETLRPARSSVLVFLKADLWPTDGGWLREMVSQVSRPEIGAVGAKLLDADGGIVHAGIALGGPQGYHLPFSGCRNADAGYFGHLHLVRTVSAVSTACMAVERSVFEAVGGFDAAFVGRPRDIDFCFKVIGRGLRVVWTPNATLSQTVPAAPRATDERETSSMAALRQRWGERMDDDPYWNPNLAAAGGAPQLAFPPSSAT
jgi:O-antigen biosynthesis protein